MPTDDDVIMDPETLIQIGTNSKVPAAMSSLLNDIDSRLPDRYADLAKAIRGPITALEEWPSDDSLWFLLARLAYLNPERPGAFSDRETVDSLLQVRNDISEYLGETKSSGAALGYLDAAASIWRSLPSSVDHEELMSKVASANKLEFRYPFPVPAGSPEEIANFKLDDKSGVGIAVNLSSRRLFDGLRIGEFDSGPRSTFRRHAIVLLNQILDYAISNPEAVDAQRRDVEILIYRLMQTADVDLILATSALRSDVSRALKRGGFSPFDRQSDLLNLIEEFIKLDYSYGTEDLGVLSRLEEVKRLTNELLIQLQRKKTP